MQSIDYFNKFSEYDDEETFFNENGKRTREEEIEEEIDDLAEELSRTKIKRFKIEDYTFDEPTYTKIQHIVSTKIKKLSGLFSYKMIDQCIMSGSFQEYSSMKVDWNVVINILSVTKEGIRKSYSTEKLNNHTIITYGSTIRSIYLPIISSVPQNHKVRSMTCELIINIDKNFLKEEKFKKKPDKIQLKNNNNLVLETYIPDLSSLKIEN